MNRIFRAVLVFSIFSVAAAAQNAPAAPAGAKPAESNPAQSKSSASSSSPTTAPRKIDRAAAYFHYTLAHMYEEQVTVYGRSELANKAMDEYRLAIQADPSSQ